MKNSPRYRGGFFFLTISIYFIPLKIGFLKLNHYFCILLV